MKKIPVGIIGATGMVGQRFVTLLKNHPDFEIVCVAASPRSAGLTYRKAVSGRWVMEQPIPPLVGKMLVMGVEKDLIKIAQKVRVVFSALDMDKDQIKAIEERLADLGVAVVSNNSAHRWSEDIPIVMPEINPSHLQLIAKQRQNRNWKEGLIVVKPNCSVQSFLPLIHPLLKFQPQKIVVTTLQAVSGAGKTLSDYPEIADNVIPFIAGEEQKSEKEPLKIWGELVDGQLKLAEIPISSTCIRVPVEDGHLAVVSVSFNKKVTKQQILSEWAKFNPLKTLELPSSPKRLITYFPQDDRPQSRLDRDLEGGMGIAVGRLREDEEGFKFIGLSHNTIRGAAGGAILTAELLQKKGLI